MSVVNLYGDEDDEANVIPKKCD